MQVEKPTDKAHDIGDAKCRKFISADLTIAKIEVTGGRKTTIAFCFISHSRDEPPEEVRLQLSSIAAEDTLILSCDVKTGYIVCGSTKINGEYLMNGYLLQFNISEF